MISKPRLSLNVARLKFALVVAAAMVIVGAQVRTAHADHWDECTTPIFPGTVGLIKWREPQIDVSFNPNLAAVGGPDVVSAALNGLDQWNSVSHLTINVHNNDPTPTEINYDDGVSEVALVPQSFIDGWQGVGVVGVTVRDAGSCFLFLNVFGITEADVLVPPESAPFTVGPGNDFWASFGRDVFIHEFGHFFGFRDTVGHGGHTVMRGGPPIPISGGAETATIWPADMLAMAKLYGDATGLPNLMASSQAVVGDQVVQLDTPGPVVQCPGGSVTASFYIGNAGITAVPTYDLRIRLSTLAPLAGGYTDPGTVVQTYTHSFPTGPEQGVFPVPFTIPQGLPLGRYFIYLDLDPSNLVNERQEGDNVTVSAVVVDVNC